MSTVSTERHLVAVRRSLPKHKAMANDAARKNRQKRSEVEDDTASSFMLVSLGAFARVDGALKCSCARQFSFPDFKFPFAPCNIRFRALCVAAGVLCGPQENTQRQVMPAVGLECTVGDSIIWGRESRPGASAIGRIEMHFQPPGARVRTVLNIFYDFTHSSASVAPHSPCGTQASRAP